MPIVLRSSLLASLFTIGCATSPEGMPDTLIGIPWTRPDFDATVFEARLLIDRGEQASALRMLDDLLVRQPRNVDAHRVRQDILRGRGRFGRVLHEAEARLKNWQNSAAARYLFGRLQPDDARKRAAFEAVIATEPGSFWGWFGLAFTFRVEDPDHAIGIYETLYERSGKHSLVALALGEVLRAAQRDDRALEVYGEQRDAPAMVGVADRCIAEVLLATNRQQEAWPPLIAALRRRPSDPGVRRVVHRLLAHGLARQHVEQILDVLFEDSHRLRHFGQSPGGASLLAELFERVGNLPAARATLADADAGATLSLGAAVQRHRRRQRLAVGDVAGFLSALRESLPGAVVRAETNRVRGVWIRLLEGSWMRSSDPLGDPVVAMDLCEALRDVGLLTATDLVATLALDRTSRASLADTESRAGISEVREEVRRELAFESAVRRVLYAGYQATDDDPGSIDDVLVALRELSHRILGKDVVGRPDVFAIPLVGRLVDPFGSPLAAHLDRYNRHLILGQRWSGAVEGMLLTRLSLRQLEPSEDLPLPGRCLEVIGDDRSIRAPGNVLGGDVAGVALLNHYIIDYDAVRDWANTILDRRRVARIDGGALLMDPIPESGLPLDPIDAEWRLSLKSTVADEDLEAAVLDMICAHERQHLVDAFYYLPPLSNPMRTLQLVFSHGFSPLSIESTMEGRAEAGALLASPHTALVLAHIAGFLRSHSEESPHAVGFRRFGEYLHGRLLVDSDLASFAATRFWHRLPVARVREFAREFLVR